MKNRFLQVSAGISMVLLAGGFFVRSLSPAKAAPPFPQTNPGKYQMAISGQNNLHILVWNTETGQSKLYEAEYNKKDVHPFYSQLPPNPLAN